MSSMIVSTSCATSSQDITETLANPVHECHVSFAESQWETDAWTLVKTSRSPHIGSWIQKPDHIQNSVPAGLSPAELQNSFETYTSMLWKQPLTNDFAVSSVMDFDNEMAPLLVFADTLGTNADGYPEYRQHWEVVLWNQGINIWHHEFIDGKQCWHLAASFKTTYTAKQKYDLKVEVRQCQTGAELTVICDDARFTYIEHDWPESVRAGITGCEGINRFYDFKIAKLNN